MYTGRNTNIRYNAGQNYYMKFYQMKTENYIKNGNDSKQSNLQV